MTKRFLFLLPLIFLGLFYFYPLIAIFGLSFAPNGEFDLTALNKLINTSYYLKTFWFTTWQATLSTLLTILLALPGAYVFAHYQFWGKNTIKAISTLPFVLPTIVVANAFTALLGPQGIFNNTLVNLFNLSQAPIQLNHTIWMILLAHVFYNYSVALRIISNFWQNLNPTLTEAASMLGASSRYTFWHITLPLLKPAIMAAAVLVFIFCFTSFGVVLILGGPQFATIEVEIYTQAVNLFNLPVAASLSLIQIIFTLILMSFYTHIQAQVSRPLESKAIQTTQKVIKSKQDKLLVGANLIVMLILLALPLLALILRSVSGKNGLTLKFYQELFINRHNSLFFVPPSQAIFNSTAIALVTVIIAVSLGLLSALSLTQQKVKSIKSKKHYKFSGFSIFNPKWLDPLFMLPLATSAVTLGFGYIIALDKPPLNLRSSLILVPIAHSLVAMPFVIRSLLPAIRSINPKLRQAAALLGASPWQVWQAIDWPLIKSALVVGAIFAFTISMGEFGATLFIARPQTPTMPVAIFRFLGQPGNLNYGQALAMSNLLMLVCAIGFIAIERFKLGDEGEF